MRGLRFTALITLALLAFACTPAEVEQELRSSETRVHARFDSIERELQTLQDERNTVPVVRILDGDTIEVIYRGLPEKIRYLDVWAPEKNEPGGPEATEYNRSLVEGRIVRLQITDKGNGRDNFGRLLADVYLLDGRHINVLIVENTEATATR